MSKLDSAVLLAAGRGKRLRPHTDHTPKPLLPFDGKPTIDYTLESLKAAGIRRVCLVVNYLADQMQAYAKTREGVLMDEIVCVTQSELNGTADAMLAGVHTYASWYREPFVLAATDYIVPEHFYPNLIAHHIEQKSLLTISLKQVDQSELAMRSSVRFNEQGLVSEVVEKPALGQAPSSLSANLVFVLPPSIVPLAKRVMPSPRGEKEIQTAINEFIRLNEPAHSLVQATPNEWQAAD